MARTIAYSSEGEWKALPPMLEEVPIEPVSLAADNGSSASQLRQSLEELGITAYIPLHPNQSSSKAARGEFVYRGDHLLCSQGKILRPGTSRSRSQSYKHPALQKDSQACPVKAECLPPRVSSRRECPLPKEKRRYVMLSMYYPMFLGAGPCALPSPEVRRRMHPRPYPF